MIDEFLKKRNLKYEDLTPDEVQTFNTMLSAMQQSTLTTEKIKEYISSMKFAVEQEITKSDNGNKHDMFLKARLKNYMLLEAFLLTPERARKALEASIKNLKK